MKILEMRSETGTFIKVGCIKINEGVRPRPPVAQMNSAALIVWIFVERSFSLSRQCNSSSQRMEHDREEEGKSD